MEMADCSIDEVDLLNCHATSTPVGDISEVKALKTVFGDALKNIPIQATKSLMGHTLGAAGANELIVGIIQCEEGFVHGMPNLDDPDDFCEGLLMKKDNEEKQVNTIIKNAFGFGGHNASVLYRKA